MDIVLGAFRYCINAPRKEEAAREMLGSVVGMMWGRKVDGKIEVRGRGLILRPEISGVKHEPYRQKYEALIAHLGRLLRERDEAGEQ